MLRVVVDANVAPARFRGSDLGLAGLQIAREMRKKRSGNLHSDAMARLENVRSEQVIEIEAINFPRLQQFRLCGSVSIAGAKHIEAGAHQVVSLAIRRYIQQTHPQ